MVDYKALAAQDASAAGIDPNFFVAQINQESGFQTGAVSSTGAIGIAQFEPSTAAGLGLNPWDPVASLKAAAQLMASYIQKFGGETQALAAYNAGPGSLTTSGETSGNTSWISNLPAQTRDYIANITAAAGGGSASTGTSLFNLPSCSQDPSSWWCFPVTQGYGVKEANTFVGGTHAGIDIGDPLGTKITAIEPGTILAAKQQAWGGDVLEQVTSSGGTIYDQFLHLESIAVQPGQTVNAGDLLGTSGGTSTASPIPTQGGYSSGPHLHFAEYTTGLPEQWGFANTIDPTQLISDLGKGMQVSGNTTTLSSNTTAASTANCLITIPLPVGGPICVQNPFAGFDWKNGLIRTGLVVGGAVIILIAIANLLKVSPNINIQQSAPSSDNGGGETSSESTGGTTIASDPGLGAV